jgi:hydrogenase maturation protein HypF
MSAAPLLVVGVGNPSRGDDAAGPLFLERIAELCREQVASGELELLTDFQLQIEHALDLVGRRRVVFVDARVALGAEPFRLERLEPARDTSHTSHALSPSAVLETYRRVQGGEPPESWLLGLRAECFELGEPPSDATRAAVEAAAAFFVGTVLADEAGAGAHFEIEGVVQGVGIRPWIAREARALGLRGSVRNTSARVVVKAFGSALALAALESSLRGKVPPPACVTSVARSSVAFREARSFEIEASVADEGAGLPIPADLSACDRCLRDVDDPASRHHGYAFTTCTACGPRFSILERLPYDRAHTTMAGFEPCAACAAEYADPGARRWHAQTLACPACGPRLWLCDARGTRLGEADPLTAAAELVVAGRILAVRGLGGFHLVCDATNARAVEELRARKRRDARPFAVMVADLDAATQHATLDDASRHALASAARPIVLVPRAVPSDRGEAPICPQVSDARVGLMLPYTPLHHLLLARVRRPVVMTSGNLSGEPIVLENEVALRVLGPIADAFLLHDRPIARRVEDSVLSVVDGVARPLRRARGFAPRHVTLPVRAEEPILAVGGHLKNTVCVVVEDRAYLSPHLGDLETVEAEEAWLREVDALERLLRVRPEVVAHDLHPDYGSTRLARRRSARVHHGVQHHVAHVLATVAELRLEGPVLGVAYDGSGWGPDGTSWGGELLLVEGPRWRRLASLRPLPLLGGEAGIRDVGRAALGLLWDAFGSEAAELAPRLACFRSVEPHTLATWVRMLQTGTNTLAARGVGRVFDAVGALALGLPRARYEAEVAMALELAADPGDAAPYPWEAPDALAMDRAFEARHELDLRPMTRALVDDLLRGTPAGLVAARFHETLVAATVELVTRARREAGCEAVVLTGGALQNRRLAEALRRRLGDAAHLSREVPVGDGGLALGQAFSAVLASHARERG